MDSWYYAQQGQSVGPIPQAQLKQMLAEGKISPDDPVWTESMAGWLPARKVPGLVVQARAAASATPTDEPTFSSAVQPTTASPYAAPSAAAYDPQGVIGYQGYGTGDVIATGRALQFLSQTRPWVMFMAVLLFLGAALCLLAGAAMVFTGSMVRNAGGTAAPGFGPDFMLILAGIYVVLAIIYGLLGWYLVRFFSAIGRLTTTRQSVDLETAMKAQMQFWRVLGITTIAGILLYIVMVVWMMSLRM